MEAGVVLLICNGIKLHLCYNGSWCCNFIPYAKMEAVVLVSFPWSKMEADVVILFPYVKWKLVL